MERRAHRRRPAHPAGVAHTPAEPAAARSRCTADLPQWQSLGQRAPTSCAAGLHPRVQRQLLLVEREIEDAEKIRVTGGVPADKQIALALFLASEQSNHISGKLIHVNDDWKRFEQDNMKPELYTLRRVQRI